MTTKYNKGKTPTEKAAESLAVFGKACREGGYNIPHNKPQTGRQDCCMEIKIEDDLSGLTIEQIEVKAKELEEHHKQLRQKALEDFRNHYLSMNSCQQPKTKSKYPHLLFFAGNVLMFGALFFDGVPFAVSAMFCVGLSSIALGCCHVAQDKD